jgi:hypothetical protein
MRASSLLLLAGSALLISSAPVYAGTVVFSDNFEGDTPAFAVTSVDSNFSTINSTNVDIVGAANGYDYLCASPESGNCIDLGGSGGNAFGQLESTPINLGPGTYELSFDLIGSGRGITTTTDVSLGSLYSNTFVLASDNTTSGIVDTTFTVGSAETVTLDFDLTGSANGNVGSVLDNVDISTVTPEPSSLMLLGTGFVALAGFARRKLADRAL